jgi:hypothetical protein
MSHETICHENHYLGTHSEGHLSIRLGLLTVLYPIGPFDPSEQDWKSPYSFSI